MKNYYVKAIYYILLSCPEAADGNSAAPCFQGKHERE